MKLVTIKFIETVPPPNDLGPEFIAYLSDGSKVECCSVSAVADLAFDLGRQYEFALENGGEE